MARAEVAERCDRIHLKTTHHQYAQHLEAVGDIAGAIEHYERADTHRTEVPRMLFAQERLAESRCCRARRARRAARRRRRKLTRARAAAFSPPPARQTT